VTEKTVALAGLGLMGGSLGLALRRAGHKVIGVDARREVVDKALARGAIDEGGTELSRVAEASMVILCTPIPATVGVATALLPHLKPGMLVTDVCSVKASIVQVLERLMPVHYIGGHPMFGSAGQGIEAADETMVSGATFIVTPTEKTPPSLADRMEQWASGLKMRTVRMDPETHDASVAAVSHLTYLVAAALTRAATNLDVAGPAFRDATRVAASPVKLWTEILSHNGSAVRAAAGTFIAELQRLLDATPAELGELLEQARVRRSGYFKG